MQQLSNHYILEYERKQDIVKSVISCSSIGILSSAEIDSGTSTLGSNDASKNMNQCLRTDPPWLRCQEIDQVIMIWSDDSQESYIETEEGNRYCHCHRVNALTIQHIKLPLFPIFSFSLS